MPCKTLKTTARVVGQNVVGGLASVLFSVVRKASAARLGLKICTLIVQVEHLAALTETAASMELTCFTIISNSVIANNTSQQCRGCPTRCSPWGWPCSYAFLIHCHLHLLETHLLIRIHSIPRVRGEDSSGVISIFCCWEHKFLSVSHVKKPGNMKYHDAPPLSTTSSNKQWNTSPRRRIVF